MNTTRIFGASCAALCAWIPAALAQAGDATPSASATAVEAAPGVLVTEKGVLDEVLMYVVDKKSADAAAPDVVRVLKDSTAMPREMLLSEYDRSILAATSCFGSTKLMAALSSVFVPDSQYNESMAPYQSLQTELGQLLHDMANVLEKVNNKASADAAAEMAQNIPSYMSSLRDKVEALPHHNDDELLRAHVRRYQVTVRPGASRVLCAWGKLMARDEDLYGSTRLASALPMVNEVLENLGMAADPGVLPQLVQVAGQMEPLLVEWLHVSKSITDTASADATAPRLQKIAADIRAVCADKLGRGFEKDLSNVSPRLQVLMMATDRISHWYAELPTPFYGSDALRAALEHEE
ncbi:MAG: hypothetical protein II349_07510 [Akkermansia sp.]|nr:hypothetical protein [Akkermansia sp.]